MKVTSRINPDPFMAANRFGVLCHGNVFYRTNDRKTFLMKTTGGDAMSLHDGTLVVIHPYETVIPVKHTLEILT